NRFRTRLPPNFPTSPRAQRRALRRRDAPDRRLDILGFPQRPWSDLSALIGREIDDVDHLGAPTAPPARRHHGDVGERAPRNVDGGLEAAGAHNTALGERYVCAA